MNAAVPDPEIQRQIAELLDGLAWELAGALGLDLYELSRQRIPQRAALLAAQLTGDDPGVAAEVAQDVGRWAGEATADPMWWQSALGRAVAATFAGPADDADVEISHAQAAELLEVSRGRIGQLLDAGRLERGPNRRVLRASVGQLLAERTIAAQRRSSGADTAS
jgi:hypothetical protein